MAWTLNWHVLSEDGETIEDVAPYTAVEFGPFETVTDVAELLRRLLAEGLLERALQEL